MRTKTGVKVARRMRSEEFYLASSWKLMWYKFKKNKLALVGMGVLGFLYLFVLFSGFFAINHTFQRHNANIYLPPQVVRWVHEGRFMRPFVYGITTIQDRENFRLLFEVDKTQIYPIRFLARGFEYKLLGLFKTNIHLVGVDEPGVFFPFGTDGMGRCLYSRVVYGARISLTIGLVGMAISFFLGCLLGGVSGYFGGWVDMLIQRIIEFLGGIPKLPLWMVLSLALPATWPPIRIYFGITVVLSIIGWTGMARVVRGKIFQLRVEDHVMAAKICGATELRIIMRHLIPGFMSYLIVRLTLAIPGMILGETSLSFLGLGLRPPIISWGVLLNEALNIKTVLLHPWLMIPAVFVIITVLSFNFMGDGARDAADPYKLQ
jgi:peptide/nickel transport system permease protein